MLYRISVLMFCLASSIVGAQPTQLQWVSNAVSPYPCKGVAVAANAHGSIATVANFQGPEIVVGGQNLVSPIAEEYNHQRIGCFVAMYTPTGELGWVAGVWSHEISVYDVEIDSAGNVYAACVMLDRDCLVDTLRFRFPTELTSCVLKFNPMGELQWLRALDSAFPYAVTVDGNGNIYTSGITLMDSVTFADSTFYALDPDSNSIYLVKYDSTGNVLWGRLFGGHYLWEDLLCVDKNENVAFGALFHSDISVDTVEFKVTRRMDIWPWELYVAKLDRDGNFLWARGMQGYGVEHGSGLSFDSKGSLILVGGTDSDSVQFDSLTVNTHQHGKAGVDGFIVKYSGIGDIEWVTTLEGNHHDYIYGLTVDKQDNIIVSGGSYSTSLYNNGVILRHDSTFGSFMLRFDSAGRYIDDLNLDDSVFAESMTVVMGDNDVSALVSTGSYSCSTVRIGPIELPSDNGARPAYYVAKTGLLRTTNVSAARETELEEKSKPLFFDVHAFEDFVVRRIAMDPNNANLTLDLYDLTGRYSQQITLGEHSEMLQAIPLGVFVFRIGGQTDTRSRGMLYKEQ